MHCSSLEGCVFGYDMTNPHVASAELTLQGVLDGITVGGASSVNASSDMLEDGKDSNWYFPLAPQDGSATIVIELAGNAGSNTFGLYDINNKNDKVNIFNGDAAAGAKVSISLSESGEVSLSDSPTNTFFESGYFGFFLGTASNGTFYSNTVYNDDETDHMYAYQGVGDDVSFLILVLECGRHNSISLLGKI